jgi:hypothetical protein
LLDCFFSRGYVNRLNYGRVSADQRGQCNNLYLPAARHDLVASSLGYLLTNIYVKRPS